MDEASFVKERPFGGEGHENRSNTKSKGLEESRPHGERWNDLRREGSYGLRYGRPNALSHRIHQHPQLRT